MIFVIRKSRSIFLLTLSLCSVFLVLVPTLVFSPNPTLTPMPVILLDPGHGGWDGGTHDFQGLLEKNIVLDFGFLLKAELEKLQFPVFMTRTTDRELSEFAPYQGTRQRTDLLARVQMASKYQADIMVSLHVNSASDSNLCGGITFYQRQSSQSKKLAAYIQKSLLNLQLYNNQTILPGNYYILNNSPVNTVLLEIAFITNPKEHNDLADNEYQKKMAQSVAQAIYQYVVDEHSKPTLFHYLF